MRTVIFLGFCACVVMGQSLDDMANMPKYDSRYDYLDVDAIFNNKRLVRNYVDCLINSRRCTPEGKALKRLLPEALRTKCVRCTERQKRTAVKIIRRLKYEHQEEWAKLSSRWDPTGDFTRYFEEFLAKEYSNTIPGSGNDNRISPPLPPTRPTAPPTIPTNPPAMSVIPLGRPSDTRSTPPRPIVLNRFGGDGELMMGSPSSSALNPRPTMVSPTMRPSTTRAVPPRSTDTMWTTAASSDMASRLPARPMTDMPPPYSTAITFIDQIGFKIIRTTEIVTDILKSTIDYSTREVKVKLKYTFW